MFKHHSVCFRAHLKALCLLSGRLRLSSERTVSVLGNPGPRRCSVHQPRLSHPSYVVVLGANWLVFGCPRNQFSLESWNLSSSKQWVRPGESARRTVKWQTASSLVTLSSARGRPRCAASSAEEARGHPMASGLFRVSDNCRKTLFSLKMYVYLTRFLFASQSGFHSVSYHSN